MASSIDYVSDWTARLVGRLYAGYRKTVSWPKVAAMLGRQAQDLEDSLQTMFTLGDIDAMRGVWLDITGAHVGQPRLPGQEDEDYRPYLRARIIANRSTGTPPRIFAVMRALLGQSVVMLYERSRVKSFALQIVTPITDALGVAATMFLRDSKSATTRAILEWQENTDDKMFTLGDGTTMTASSTAGDTVLQVRDTTDIVVPGFVMLAASTDLASLASSEVVDVVSKTATSITVTGTGQNHAIGTTVESVDGFTLQPLGPGLGLDSAYMLDTARSIGDLVLTVVDTLAFDASGKVIIDEGLASEETVAYGSLSGSNVINLSTPLTKNHAKGATVQEVGWSLIGGELAAAAQA